MRMQNTDNKPFEWNLKTGADAVEGLKKHRELMDQIFHHDNDLGYITINKEYPYEIALDRIPDPEALLHWIHHLLGKRWMTGRLALELIERVYDIKGWDLYRRNL